MPVEFLTHEQEQCYGCYNQEPSPAQLARYFHLDDADRPLVVRRRGNHNRLGFALQLCTVRFLGTFLTNPTDVPAGAISFVSSQLGITDSGCLLKYLERPTTPWEHAREIARHYGYRDFSDRLESFSLVRWLYERAWFSAERPSVLFDLATARLVERKVLLPGVSTLARLVARVRDRTATRLWRVLSQIPNPEQCKRLEQLLVIPDGSRQTPLDRLRRSPTRQSAPALVEALQRLVEVRELGVGGLDLHAVPPSRIAALARHAAAARAQTLARMHTERRVATMLAFARILEAMATDDAMELLDLLIGELLADSERTGKTERLRTLRNFDKAALQLCEACDVLLNPECEDIEVRSAIFAQIKQEHLATAVATVRQLARPRGDNYYELLLNRWRTIRRFLPVLLGTIDFGATEAGQPILEALHFLKKIEGRSRASMDAAPLAIVNRSWQQLQRFSIG